MPCNATEEARRRCWEYLDSENAPCMAQIGFGGVCGMSAQWWQAFDHANFTGDLQWLNVPNVLNPAANLPGLTTGRFDYNQLGGSQIIALQFNGFNIPNDDTDGVWTVQAACQVNWIELTPPFLPHIDISAQVQLWPNPKKIWKFSDWVQVVPVPGGAPTVFGEVTISPLQACNGCSRGT